MTPEQFEVLATLMRSREPAKTAARLVLVDGLAGVESARQAGVSPQSVSNAVTRYRVADAAIRGVYPVKEGARQ